tara:strand:- start:997 stop:1473 length:477 start_codon:yes stop_codon:yes gene_type:complete
MHGLKPEEKRISRYICVQIIYAYELSSSENNKNYDSIFTKHFHADLENSYGQLSKAQLDYSRMLYIESIKNRDFIDKLIQERLKNWDISRLAIIDRIILRMSASEMFFIDEVPPKVSIAEGVEIAKVFSTKDSSSFVNGILDAIYNEVYIKDNKVSKV